VTDLKGPGYRLLGDHFHPILATLAPLYRLFPSPVTLLLAQAALIAVSIVPVTRTAVRFAGPRAGLAIGVAYALSYGLQRAVNFDFHEVCFAVPLLAMVTSRLLLERWTAAAAWSLPLVLVKEDLPLTVAAVGGYLLLRRQQRLGAALVAFGVTTWAVLVTTVIPFFGGGQNYVYHAGSSAAGPLTRLLTPDAKLSTLLMLLLPTAFLALRSPLMLLAVPTLAWRFWSTTPNHWLPIFHYDAVLMPIVFLALVDALTRVRTPAVVRVAPAVAVLVTLHACLWLPVHRLADPDRWRTAPDVVAARALLRQIPAGATVAADDRLASQLTSSRAVYLFPHQPDDRTRPQWVALRGTVDTGSAPAENPARGRLAELGYRVVASGGGVVLYRRTP
jgi:uncharacterized membrane protein